MDSGKPHDRYCDCGRVSTGLGPYHAQTLDGIPGSYSRNRCGYASTAADAAGLLNALARSPRPSVFLFPKSLINDRSRTTSEDVAAHYVPIGKANVTRAGSDLRCSAGAARCLYVKRRLKPSRKWVYRLRLLILERFSHGMKKHYYNRWAKRARFSLFTKTTKPVA